jgi:hypothetical protein
LNGPRATVAVAVNVFVGPEHLDTVRAALSPLGVAPPPVDGEVGGGDEAWVARDGQSHWWWGRTPVDLFFAYDPLHDAMRNAIRSVPFGDDRIPVPDFDSAEVRQWLEHLLADDDQRHKHFGQLATQMLGCQFPGQ